MSNLFQHIAEAKKIKDFPKLHNFFLNLIGDDFCFSSIIKQNKCFNIVLVYPLYSSNISSIGWRVFRNFFDQGFRG